ncbi:hypothetical protein [Streptococcus cristatus]|uniref:Uncharacterized protein n=1 Tax=Streptococcus cristatus TaxID=45634 RepID=A0A139N481_STRCR|nr:hypothetical protein [Streptococcus cristatus]KXT70742.1 hypothetical protein SCRDD08_00502 [Streptococcus cristatus]
MTLDRYKAIVKRHADNFKELFERKVFEGGFKRFVNTRPVNRSDFSIFNIASDNFYIYQEYEKTLQSDIRNYLINPILEELLNENGYEIESPLEKMRSCVGFRNSAIEQYDLFSFQFIIKRDNIRIGVRYTELYDTDDVVRELIKDFQIDKVIILDFSNDTKIGSNAFFEIIDNSHYSIKMFLDEFINENLYQYFLTSLTEVIDDIQKLIGFDVIPRLNMSNLTRVRLKLRESLQGVDFHALRYNSKNKFNNLEKYDLDIICSNFEEGKAQVLLGKSDFAKSYLTSEYLYQVLVDNCNFDYTSVVAGYLKTIEQFLYQILLYQLKIDKSEKWIKRGKKYVYRNKKRIYPRKEEIRENPKNDGSYQILVTRNNLQFMDVSLGSLIWYVTDNENCWEISEQGRKLLNNFLLDYKDSVRNGYFHKHNLEDIEEMKRIRNNTLFLLNFMIGSLRDFDITKFGALDFSFNDFYISIFKHPKYIPLYIQETKTSQPQMMKMVYHQEPESYDEDGLLEQNLYFAKIENPKTMYEWVADVPKNDLVIFNTKNVPYRAEYERRTDKGFVKKD